MKVKDMEAKLKKGMQNENDEGKDKTLLQKFDNADKAFGIKPSAAKREKALRKLYTIPPRDLRLIDEIKNRTRVRANSSEIVRAGLRALNNMTDKELIDILSSIEQLPKSKRG